jgi:hypothetical protein
VYFSLLNQDTPRRRITRREEMGTFHISMGSNQAAWRVFFPVESGSPRRRITRRERMGTFHISMDSNQAAWRVFFPVESGYASQADNQERGDGDIPHIYGFESGRMACIFPC